MPPGHRPRKEPLRSCKPGALRPPLSCFSAPGATSVSRKRRPRSRCALPEGKRGPLHPPLRARVPGRFLRRTLPCAAANDCGAATSDAFDSPHSGGVSRRVRKARCIAHKESPAAGGASFVWEQGGSPMSIRRAMHERVRWVGIGLGGIHRKKCRRTNGRMPGLVDCESYLSPVRRW